MAELVDALDSKSNDGNIVGVQVPPPAPESFESSAAADSGSQELYAKDPLIPD